MGLDKSPSFSFYAQDFLTGVMFLTNEEIGIYIKMLAKQWTDGKIPKKRLGFLVGLDWDNFSDELREKFKDCGDYVLNERLEDERQKKQNYIKKQSENGKKGGRPRKQKPNKSQEKPNPLENQKPEESQKKPYENEIEDEIEKEIEVEKEVEIKRQKVDCEKVVAIFNSVCTGAPEVKKLTEQRKIAIRARVKEYGLSELGNVFQAVGQSSFLNGQNSRGWVADFDWVLKPSNFIKILEGKYKNNGKAESTTGKSKTNYSDDFKRKIASRLQSG